MLKKGQSAMEYLMTYGWAILIVIVVVAALYAMGVFKITPTVKCSPCFGTADFTYIDHNSTDLVLKCGPRALSVGGTPYSTGEVIPVDISGTCTGAWTDCAVAVAYTVTESGMSHSSSATLHQ